jgi:hypothetical protein
MVMYPRVTRGGLRAEFALLASPRHEQTQPGEEGASPIGLRCKRMRHKLMSIGTSECFTNSDPCEAALKGVEGEAGALSNKPLVHIVEVSIIWETRGPHGHKR